MPPKQQGMNRNDDDEEIGIDLGDEYDQVLTNASQEEIIDLAGINSFKHKLKRF